MYDNNVPFHVILKKERKRRGWSQAYVAEKLGTDFRVVSRWERGLHLPTAYHRPALCALFNMSAACRCPGGSSRRAPDRLDRRWAGMDTALATAFPFMEMRRHPLELRALSGLCCRAHFAA